MPQASTTRTQTGTTVRTTPAALVMMLRSVLLSRQSDPGLQNAIQDTLSATLSRNPRFNPKTINPLRFNSFSQIDSAFGGIGDVLQLLTDANQIPIEEARNIYNRCQFESELDILAAQAAKLPTRELKYTNVSANIISDQEDKERIEDLQDRRDEAHENLANELWDRPKFEEELNRINEEEERFRAEREDTLTNRIPIGASTNHRFQEIKARLQNPNLSPSERKRLENEERRLEKIVAGEYERYYGYTQPSHFATKNNRIIHEKQKRENVPIHRRNQYDKTKRAESRHKRALRRFRAGIHDPETDIQLLNDRFTPHPSEGMGVIFDKLAGENGLIDRKPPKTELKGAAKAAALTRTIEDIERTLQRQIEFELNKKSSDSILNREIARNIAKKLAPRIGESHEAIADQRGINAATHTTRFYNIELNQRERREAARIAIETQLRHADIDSDTAVQNTRAWLDSIHNAIQRTPITTRQVKMERVKGFKLSKGLRRHLPRGVGALKLEEKLMQVEPIRGDHVISQTNRTAVLPSVAGQVQAFSNAYRAGIKIGDATRLIDGYISDPGNMQARIAKQVAFAQGANLVRKKFEENPIGAIPELTADYLYSLTPESLQKASIGTRSALLGLATSVPFGPAVGAFAGLSHADFLMFDKFKKTYAPFIDTKSWLEGYIKGQALVAMATIGPGSAFITEDNRGGIAIGAKPISGGWNVLIKGIGKTIERAYENNVFNLSRTFGRAEGQRRTKRNVLMNIGFFTSERLKDDKKKRDPISLLLGLGWSVAKGFVVGVLENTPIPSTIRHFLKNNGGDLWNDFRYGSGYSDPARLTQIRRELIDEIKIDSNSQAYNDAIQKIDTRLNRLELLGKGARGISASWQAFKTGAEVIFRGAGVAGVAFLLGQPAPVAIALGAGYSIPWGIRKIINTPIYGGFFSWSGGGYHPGLLSKWNWSKNWLGKLSEASQLPMRELIKAERFSGFFKGLASVNKFMPWDGIWIGSLLATLGVPLPVAYGFPIGIDLGTKIFREISKLEKFEKFFSATGTWVRFTGFLSVGFNIGSLAHALEQGGFSGLFKIFTEGFSVQNLLRFSTIPGTYLSFLGLAGAFGGTLLGMPGAIAAGVLTIGTIGVDQLMRFLGTQFDILWLQHGLWSPFKWAVDGIWKFIKNKGWNIATGALSSILGLFSLFSSAMKGDIQGMAISLVLMSIGGYIFVSSTAAVSPFPSSYNKPTLSEGSNVYNNTYLKSANKNFIKVEDNKLTYKYYYAIDNLDDNDINSITISEKDVFQGIPDNSITEVTSDDNLSLNNLTVSTTNTFNSQGTISRTFVIVLSDNLATLLPDQDDKLCNTLTINIDDLQSDSGSVNSDESPVSITKCINNQGNESIADGTLTHIPISSGQITIPGQCFDADRAYQGGVVHGHRGLDFVPNLVGSTAYAIAAGDGEVIATRSKCTEGDLTGDCQGWGNYVMLQHGNSYKTVYAHLRTVSVNVNNQVQGGDQLGIVGTTGWSTGIHLHFGVIDGDLNTSNPDNYLNPCALSLDICNSVPNSGGCTASPQRVTR